MFILGNSHFYYTTTIKNPDQKTTTYDHINDIKWKITEVLLQNGLTYQ